jgi:hypothetical protein
MLNQANSRQGIGGDGFIPPNLFLIGSDQVRSHRAAYRRTGDEEWQGQHRFHEHFRHMNCGRGAWSHVWYQFDRSHHRQCGW